MANVVPDRTSDRGQMILVTALLISATLLVLVLLLNGVIYTENVATRGTSGEVGGVTGYQATVTEELSAVLAAENQVQRADSKQDFDNLTDRLDDALGTLNNRTRDAWLDRGRLAEFEYELIEGLLVWQDEDGDFNDTRQFGVNIDRGRSFTLNVTTADLHDIGDVSLENVTNESIEENALGIYTPSDSWEIRLFHVDGGAAVTDGGNESICDVDTFTGDRLIINVTNESVNGVDCSGGLWGDGGKPLAVSAPFEVGVYNPENVSGQYELVATGEGMTADAPHWAMIADSANLTITFESAKVRYEANTTTRGAVP